MQHIYTFAGLTNIILHNKNVSFFFQFIFKVFILNKIIKIMLKLKNAVCEILVFISNLDQIWMLSL